MEGNLLAVHAPEETIKSGTSATEESFQLHIGERKVAEVTDKVRADYERVEEIGKGGMGTVWEARQSSLNRKSRHEVSQCRCIGVVGQQVVLQRTLRDQFMSEVVVTGKLDHPNIVPIYDLAHDQDGQPFYSMKRVEGRPWNECIKGNEQGGESGSPDESVRRHPIRP